MRIPKRGMLIFQTTPFCNIDCSYCYLPNRSSKTKLSSEIVFRTARVLADARWGHGEISILWHAGEPLAVGVDHLDELMEACTPLQSVARLQHYVQTNGTLLNSRFCELFKRRNVRVGISIDGPKALHDQQRMTRNKMGTFDAVMKGIDLLKEHNLNFSVICVLTSRSLDMAEELYFFFEDLGASSVGFNIDEIEGTNRRSSMDSLDFADKIRDFWRALFKVHFARHSFRLREADGLVQMLRHGSPEITYNHQVDPLAILVVSVQGEVGTFSPELLGQNNVEFDNFSIGNIQTDSLADIIAGERYVRLKNEIEIGVNNCAQTCSYFEVCGGGPPSNKVFELGTFRGTETKYCRAAIMSVTDALVSEAKERMRSEGNVNALVALK